MENLNTLRERVRQRRETFTKADDAYYQALQWYTLALKGQAQRPGSPPTLEEIEKRKQAREEARFNLQAAINLLAQTDSPQNLIRQLPADLPFLLLPVRIEARYITYRYVIRRLNPEDTIDVSTQPGENLYQQVGFGTDEEGTPTYQVQALHLGGNPPFANKIKKQQIMPPSNQYIERRPDREELCIRIYPDEIFTEAHEHHLTPAEWEAGKAFWREICTKSAPEETTWLNFTATIPPARAAWIVRATRPVNYPFGGALPANPQFTDTPLLKDGAYTLPPAAQLLPDRFVVRLYKGDQFKEFIGNPIPEPLRLGLDLPIPLSTRSK